MYTYARVCICLYIILWRRIEMCTFVHACMYKPMTVCISVCYACMHTYMGT